MKGEFVFHSRRLIGAILLVGIILTETAFAATAIAAPKIQIRTTSQNSVETAEVLLNEYPFLTLVSQVTDTTPAHLRAVLVGAALQTMDTNKQSLGDIMPDVMPGGRVVGRVGETVVFEVTPFDAKFHLTPRVVLVTDWCNRIRKAMGTEAVPTHYVEYLIYKDRMGSKQISLLERENVAWDVAIDDKVVMSFSKVNYQQAVRAVATLQDLVLEKVPGKKIMPSQDSENVYGGKIAGQPFFEISKFEEMLNGQPAWQLSVNWINNVRVALGYPEIAPSTVASTYSEKGGASWYGEPFHGRRAASGQRYDMYEYTAAHKTLPFGSEVLVTRLDNFKSVVVRINDRGPYIAGRIIDLSLSAARAIGMTGIAPVRIDVIGTHKVVRAPRVSSKPKLTTTSQANLIPQP